MIHDTWQRASEFMDIVTLSRFTATCRAYRRFLTTDTVTGVLERSMRRIRVPSVDCGGVRMWVLCDHPRTYLKDGLYSVGMYTLVDNKLVILTHQNFLYQMVMLPRFTQWRFARWLEVTGLDGRFPVVTACYGGGHDLTRKPRRLRTRVRLA